MSSQQIYEKVTIRGVADSFLSGARHFFNTLWGQIHCETWLVYPTLMGLVLPDQSGTKNA